MVQGVPGADVYPPGVESRDAYVVLADGFAPGETTPIVILADVEGSPTDVATITAITEYSAEVDPHRRTRPGRGSVCLFLQPADGGASKTNLNEGVELAAG